LHLCGFNLSDMRKIVLFFIPGVLLVYGVAAQHGDTQSVSVRVASQLAAQPAMYSKNAVMDFFQNQQFEEAIAYLSPILQADSGDLDLLGYAGYAYFMSDNSRAAATCYRHMLALDSSNVAALHYLVLIRSNEDPEEAYNYAAQLLQLQPDREPWWRIMGELSARRGKPDAALGFFEHAYSMMPGDARAVAGLAELLIENRSFARADSMLDGALGKDSMNSSLLKLRVKAAFFAKKYADAIVPGERLVASNEPASQALTWLALSYYELQRYPDCIQTCGHMVDIGLDLEQVYYYEAESYAKLREYRVSDSLLRICLTKAIQPTAEWYYDVLASNHEALHEYKQAIAHYDTSYYLFKDPTTLYTCGRIAETELHNMTLARRYYLRYLEVGKPVSAAEKEAYLYVRKRWGNARK
jgi:tetratricopeptide (TPR) repeat protein